MRTTDEAAIFGLWRDADRRDELVRADFLTTARYEPVIRNGLGCGVVDLLFENDRHSCVLAGLRLDPNSLITRERSPLMWPAADARALGAERLQAIESRIVPWLRSLARARPMASESIRRFAPSVRFDRARAADFVGAAPLQRVMRRMAPYVYARRFAAGLDVWLDTADDALGHAILAGTARSIGHAAGLETEHPAGDRCFAHAWYGIVAQPASAAGSELAIVDRPSASAVAPIVLCTAEIPPSRGIAIAVPSPAPLDLLFSFDTADAPPVTCFSVVADEPALRPASPAEALVAVGGSDGTIVIGMSAVARAMRGADVDEVDVLSRCLSAEGLTVRSEVDFDDRTLEGAQLVHIVGAPSEAHTIGFAQAARRRGIDYVFDVSPRAANPSGGVENMLSVALRAATDIGERSRYLQAYEERRVSAVSVPEPTAEEYAQLEALFFDLAPTAVAILACNEDVAELRERLPAGVAERVLGRGVFLAPEPDPSPIGHLVGRAPFALVDGPIAPRSHALYVALCAERAGVPLVVAGPCYDVEYLQTLRANAPNAVILADPDAGTRSALYRRAEIWVDAAPRPRSAAGLIRAVAAGALPVIAAESPLSRIAGPDAPVFSLTSFAEAAETLASALSASDRDERMSALRARLESRGRLARSFSGVLGAYARVATVV